LVDLAQHADYIADVSPYAKIADRPDIDCHPHGTSLVGNSATTNQNCNQGESRPI
jgi:hypothetical protein